MKNTHLALRTHTRHQAITRTCIICKEKFQLSETEIILIENGEIGPLDVNICNDCADRAAEQWEEEEQVRELRDYIYN